MAFLQRFSPRSVRIAAASALALSFVGAAFLITSPSFWKTRSVNAESTDQLLAAYASKDTDGDGLPDWQEALYGTDPSKAISNSYGIPDGQAAKEGKLTPNTLSSQLPQDQNVDVNTIPGSTAAAGSLTDQFSQEFLQEYVSASNGQPMTDEQQQALVTKLLGEFTQKAVTTLGSRYTIVSVHTDPSASTLEYAGAVEDILRAHDVDADANQPIQLMDALIEKNDASARPKLVALQKSYASIASDLVNVHVPPALAEDNLNLIQSFDTLAKATQIVANYEQDPLGVMGALTVYQPSSKKIVDTFNDLATKILVAGEPAAGAPGSTIVNIARSAQTQ